MSEACSFVQNSGTLSGLSMFLPFSVHSTEAMVKVDRGHSPC